MKVKDDRFCATSALRRRVMRVFLLAGIFASVRSPQAVMAAGGCTELGGAVSTTECVISSPVSVSATQSNVFDIDRPLRITNTGSITVPGKSSGNSFTLNVTGDVTLDGGAKIIGDITDPSASAAVIVVGATGSILLQSGAKITANQDKPDSQKSCSGGRAGNITLRADQNITLESGAEVRVDAKCPAGEIIIEAGLETFIDGIVSSASGMTGVGTKSNHGGGPITVKAACNATIGDTGVVHSKGRDPGADLVHIEGGCAVKIFGLVASDLGHGPPTDPPNRCNLNARPHPDAPKDNNGNFLTPAACVEIWSGGTLEITRTSSHKGEVNIDVAQKGGSDASSWVDIFARGDISISGPALATEQPLSCNGADEGSLSQYAIHANQTCLQNSDGGVITVKSTEGKVTAAGLAIQSSAIKGGGRGGHVTVEAKNELTLNTASLEAQGDCNQNAQGNCQASGVLGFGGVITARSFTKTLSWQNGNGDVQPTGGGVSDVAKRGIISLQDCTAGALNTTGTIFPASGATPPPPTTLADACAGAPTLPAYVTLPACGCGPGISITKACAAAISSDGTKVTVTVNGEVKNTGNVKLNSVVVTDNPPLVFSVGKEPPTSLNPGQSALYEGTYEATTIPANGFTDTISVTAIGAANSGSVNASQSATCLVNPKTGITVTKQCTDASTPLGQPVKFNGQVCNPSDEQLTTVTVTDAPPAKSLTLTKNILAPKECTTYNGTYETTQVGKQTDSVTAQGKGKLSLVTAMSVPATAECTVVGPAIDVTKSCTAAITDGGTMITVTVNGVIKNIGGVKLNNIKIKDDPAATFLALTKTSLSPNEEVSYEGSYKVSAIPADGLKDIVTAEGDGENSTGHMNDTAPAECSITPSPAVTITQECDSPETPFGQPLKFKGVVCNTGNEQLTDLTLTYDKPNTTIGFTPTAVTSLAPGACSNYAGSYLPSGSGAQIGTATVAAKGKISNQAISNNSSATCQVVERKAQIEITKTCVATITDGGSSITVNVNGTISNTGNVALSNIQLTDDPPVTLTPVTASLGTGASDKSTTFSGFYKLSAIPASGIKDTVTVTATGANSSGTATAQASAQCSLTPSPKITIDQACTTPNVLLGQPIKFEGQVCNTGNEQLKNLALSDDKNVVTPKSPSLLAPGGCIPYSATFIPGSAGPQADKVSVAGLGALSNVTVSALTNPGAQCTVTLPLPALTVTKDCACNINPDGASASVQFSGQVCNTGQERLVNIKIVDNKPSLNTPVSFPSVLEVNQCLPFNGSYATTTGANSDVVTVTATGAISGQPVGAQDDATCACTPNSGLTITTQCSPSVGHLDMPISFSGKICNTGNIALSGVTASATSTNPAKMMSLSLVKTALSALPAGQTPGNSQCVTYSGKYKPKGAAQFSHTVTTTAQSMFGGITQQASASATCALAQSCVPADWAGLAAANSWIGYNPNQRVSNIFSATNSSNFSSVGKLSLAKALGYYSVRGTLPKAAASLIKAAVAALLNAAHPQIFYAIENQSDIIAQVNTALASGNVRTIKQLTAKLSYYNNLGGASAVCQTQIPPC